MVEFRVHAHRMPQHVQGGFMAGLQVKMKELGVTTHADYKVTVLMDHKSMITVQTEKYGGFPFHHHSPHPPALHWLSSERLLLAIITVTLLAVLAFRSDSTRTHPTVEEPS